MQMLVDHIVLGVLVGFVSMLLFSITISPLLGSILYFGLPSAYLVFKKPYIFKLALPPVIIFGFIYAIGFEYINEVGGSWVFPLAQSFIFPQLFFGIVPGDVIVWYILWVFMVVAYYEYFIVHRASYTLVMRRVYKVLGFGFLGLGVIAVAEYAFNASIVIPYAYTVSGLAALIPVFILYKRKPKRFPKLFQTIPFLAAFFLVMEVIALTVGYWELTGGSVFLMSIAGHAIPIEEIILWIIASPLVLSAYHELFLDEKV